MDIPLSTEGVSCAHKLGASLSSINVAKFYSSPLKRALQTAGIIVQYQKKSKPDDKLARQEKIMELGAFREISLGLWEGKSSVEIKKEYPGLWEERGKDFGATRPPKGESYEDLALRVLPAFSKLCRNLPLGKISILVSHRSVLQVIMAQLLNIDLAQAWKLELEYGATHEVEIKGKKLKLIA